MREQLTHSDAHPCYWRGCQTIVVDRYCERHQAAYERQQEARRRRNIEAAAERRARRGWAS